MTPQLRFPEFTDDWHVKKLGELGKFTSGVGFTNSEQGGKRGTPFYKVSDMNLSGNTNEMTQANNYVSDTQVIDMKYKPIIDKSIIFAKVGAAIFLERKRVASNFLIDNNMMAFTPNGNLDFQYIKIVFDRLHLSKMAQVGALPSYNGSDLAIIKVQLPSHKEQEKIADFLTAVDERIRLQEQKLAKLEQYKRGVMQQIFSQKIRFKDENGNEYPEWEEKKLGEIGETYNGLTGKAGDDFGNGSPFITYMQIFSNSKISGKFGKVRISANEKQNTVKYGDIFFTTSSETPEETGFTSVLLDNLENTYLNSFCFGYRVSKNQLLPEFARYLFHSVGVRSAIVRLAQGSTRYNISKIALMNMAIFLPSHKEQQKIATFLTALDNKITAKKSKLTAAKQFKKALLQRMFV